MSENSTTLDEVVVTAEAGDAMTPAELLQALDRADGKKDRIVSREGLETQYPKKLAEIKKLFDNFDLTKDGQIKNTYAANGGPTYGDHNHEESLLFNALERVDVGAGSELDDAVYDIVDGLVPNAPTAGESKNGQNR